MDTGQTILSIAAGLSLLAMIAFWVARKQALATESGGVRMHSRPGQYGWYAALMAILPGLAVGAIGTFMHLFNLAAPAQGDIVIAGLLMAAAGAWYGMRSISPALRARNIIDRAIRWFLLAAALVSIATTIGIVLSVLFESIRFFQQVSIWEFLTGTNWSPTADFSVGEATGESRSKFGALPLFTGTLVIATIAMLVALPIGLLSAIYMAEYAPPRIRAIAKPVLEVLAGIPTVVYGFFAALTVSPLVIEVGQAMGLEPSFTNALAPGLVMGIMIVPFISSLTDDVLNSVPDKLRQGSYALGMTRAETIKNVVIPSAAPGIVAAFLLGVSRALGETMIVTMAAGQSPNMSWNPLEGMTTITVQIAATLTGDLAFDTPATQSAFALGLMLFIITLTFNYLSLVMIRRMRARYV